MNDVPEACLWAIGWVLFGFWEGIKLAWLPFLAVTVASYAMRSRRESSGIDWFLLVVILLSPFFLATDIRREPAAVVEISFLALLVGVIGGLLGIGFGEFLARKRKRKRTPRLRKKPVT